ncbi:hypothetical protein L9F63_021886 [Diploptera punctata]|uniref:C2H2-type domain-containing protein n=1 Tax=Diploptera punctata TaxID=6984 RepID=A0AAD7ZNP0_DIPPU|nr:hypothetical protein L9F63_021886 [Diploptera punctata]
MTGNQSTFQDPSTTVNEINIIIETTKQELPEHEEKFSNTFTFSSGEQCDGNVANLMKPESENNTFEIPVKHVYKCDICVKYFTNEITLQCHHNNFHSGTPICCEICNEYCESPMDYFDHMKKKHARNENASNENICFFICNHCGQQFPDNQLLQEHYKAHQVNCNLCEFCAVNDEMLKVHTILKHSESLAKQSLITCTVCQQVFVHMQQAANHIKCHNVNNQMLQHLDLHVIYNCEYCFTSYAEKSALKIHYNDHNDKMYFCNLCKEKFSNARQVEYHKVIYCGLNQSEIFDVPKMFVCFECDEAFLNVETLSKHNRIHEEMNEMYSRNTFQIEGCNNNKTASVLEDKTNKELNAPPSKQKKKVYMCNVCGDIFTLKNLFDKHFQKHTNECGYFCEICGRNFNHKSGLYTHRRIHTGEKPYPCDLCDKTFRLKHDRDNHRRCHTGERPFKCEYCGKAFRTNHDHRQHLFIHTGQRPYVCNFCGKGFRRINGLNVHRRTHTGEKPYGCDSCGRRFTQKGDMLKHRKTQHALK